MIELPNLALRYRVAVLAATLLLIGVGIWAFQNLKVEAYPDISDTGVVVITQFPGNAAEEVEQQVTIPIERALNNTPNVIARRSRTIFGLSVVELTFDDGVDDYFARQLVLERLRDAELPEGVQPGLGPLTSGIGEMYRYRLDGPQVSEMKLRELQDWVVLPRLLQVPGVADVATFGGLVKTYLVELDPLKLEKFALTAKQVADAISANNRNAGGGIVDNQQQSLVVRGVGLVRSRQDIERIVIGAFDGVPLFVRDVARVSVAPALQTGIFGYDDVVGGVEGIVLLRRWENPSDTLTALKAAIAELNAQLAPQGVQLVTVYDRGELVTNTLRTVSRTLLEGLIIVTLVLFFFLGDVRAALLTALTIPLSLLFAFICLKVAGIPANLLSLGALDFGIIVDGTLVMVEHIVHRLAGDAGRRRSVLEAVRRAALEIERPIFFSLVILICAYLPLFTMERVEYRLFGPMAFTVCSALLGTLLLSLTLTPVLASYWFGRSARAWENPVVAWLRRAYGAALTVTLARPRLTVAVATVVVLGGLGVGSRLGLEFLPQLDEGVIWIRANLPPGVSLTESARTASRMRAIIREFPEVSLVISQSGRNDDGTDPFGPNRNELLINLHPYETWTSGRTKAQLVAEMSRRLESAIPGATFNFTQPIIDTSTEMATGSSADLAIIIRGPDLKQLRELAKQALSVTRQIPGAADTSIEQEADQPQLRLRVNREEVARYGINVADVQDLIELAVGGRPVGVVFEGERRFDIVVRYTPDARANAAAIGKLLAPTADGGRVPLSQLADIAVVEGASIIARRENQRQITVRTNIRGRDQGGFVSEAQAAFAKQVVLPEGYSVEWGGQFENLTRARARLTIVLPVTLVLIFGLLFLTFGRARDAAIVLASVPFALVGGLVALWLRDINLSVSAAVGFISLFGVAVMSGVLIVSEINRLREAEGLAVNEAIFTGARNQMRPVLMMLVVALLGMIPAARAVGIGSDVQRPLATVVVGGLFSALILTLLALPSLYAVVAGDKAAPVVEEPPTTSPT
ncbi:efflux RND transporter permease subunit [Chloracidobacterium validum]|uniref:Efflux RND transporter permease subunit n=1 Tax=Chloracidobacterium validum TaxID=2821543 RepID=A0ABX8BE60_9BACT|nr:CusA/CzcA family heavy metal efflux RND transporter [Chloracidobacterium validum]QUW04165.1 efflux RND transporter permease subunit [Chloracidobacterium validum]